ncbi:MAG: ABC transporter permease [Clostridia bacterium]|nr:ABC transporter permease [Clostridia bacterium]
MNIMNRVTWNTMRKNRVRTIVTIIGIVLSTAMFAAVLTLCTTFYKFMLDTEKAESGSYHIHALNMRGADIKTLRNDERLEYAALTEVMGYAVFEGQSGAQPYLCLLAADDAFLDNMPVDIMEGRLPENSSEVVLSNFITDFAQDPIAVGDTLTLEVGDRMLKSENGSVTGERLYQNSDFLGDMEELVNRETVTLTVVGICERPDFEPFSAPGYTMLTHMDDGMTDDGVYGCYIRVKNPIRNFSAFEKDYYALMTEGYELHSSLLALEGSSQYANLNQLLISFAVILCLIIFIGSVSLISARSPYPFPRGRGSSAYSPPSARQRSRSGGQFFLRRSHFQPSEFPLGLWRA